MKKKSWHSSHIINKENKKSRFIELANIAQQTVELIESKDVFPEEYGTLFKLIDIFRNNNKEVKSYFFEWKNML